MLSCERSTGCRYQPIQLKLYMNIAYGLMMTPIDFGRPWPMTLTYRGQSSSKLDAFLWTRCRLQILTYSNEFLHEDNFWSNDDTCRFWLTLTYKGQRSLEFERPCLDNRLTDYHQILKQCRSLWGKIFEWKKLDSWPWPTKVKGH